MTDVELVLDAHAVLAEGPSWDARDNSLLWTDIPAGTVHRFDPASGEDHAYEIGREIGAVVPRARGGYAYALKGGFAVSADLGSPLEMIAAVEADQPGNRMNDGKCDPAGRFWAGSLSYAEAEPLGAFYRLDPDHTVRRVFGDVTVSNGLGWDPSRRHMYYIDTPTGRVDLFDYDQASGDIRNRRPLLHIPAAAGYPDGMTVDSDGYLWVALWDGWGLRRYAPDGTLDRTIPLPVQRVTSCVFGGPDLDVLFITTASVGVPDAERARQPHAGALFDYRPGVTGMPTHGYAG